VAKYRLVLHLGVALWVAIPLVYFLTAGARTFTVPEARDSGAILGQVSFISGMLCALGLGFYQSLAWPLAACGAVLASSSVVLYEYTRRTVVDRNFYTALGGVVPAGVCERGPYRYIRHPFYLSYMVAFLAVMVAFPSPVTAAVCALNIALFVYLAFDDERVLLRSGLAGDYEAYRKRVGMFVPRVQEGLWSKTG
jgi:protein-S-isoprenylcysteine O-methyltransferase Ste14